MSFRSPNLLQHVRVLLGRPAAVARGVHVSHVSAPLLRLPESGGSREIPGGRIDFDSGVLEGFSGGFSGCLDGNSLCCRSYPDRVEEWRVERSANKLDLSQAGHVTSS